MPHVTSAYLDYLISHELCHQWWYNAVGTNGYCRDLDERRPGHVFQPSPHGPKDRQEQQHHRLSQGAELAAQHRAARTSATTATWASWPAARPGRPCRIMPKFKHLVNLIAMTYDRGSKIVGMIEQRLGEAAFLDFMRHRLCQVSIPHPARGRLPEGARSLHRPILGRFLPGLALRRQEHRLGHRQGRDRQEGPVAEQGKDAR